MAQAGWYNDNSDPTRARWHDGTQWTDHTIVKAEWAGRGTPPPPVAPSPVFPTFPEPADPSGSSRPTTDNSRGLVARYWAWQLQAWRASWAWFRGQARWVQILVGVAFITAVIVTAIQDSQEDPDPTPQTAGRTGSPEAAYLALLKFTPEAEGYTDAQLLQEGRNLCTLMSSGTSASGAWAQWRTNVGNSGESNHLFQAILTAAQDNGDVSLCDDHEQHYEDVEAWLESPAAVP